MAMYKQFQKIYKPLFPPFIIICIKSKFLLLYILANIVLVISHILSYEEVCQDGAFMAILMIAYEITYYTSNSIKLYFGHRLYIMV